MDGYHELIAWVLLGCIMITVFLVQVPAAARAAGRLGERVVARLTAEPEPDQDAVDLYQAMRRERLLQHAARLRRILADDAHQSAVRQIGNRLAYASLLGELAEIPDLPLLAHAAASTAVTGWSSAGPTVAVAGRGSSQYAPRVETLDLGGRRR